MSVLRYGAPAIALAAGAFAQCSTSGTLTITNSADAAVLGSCSTYTGNIAIATAATEIALDGPSRIRGDVIVAPQNMLTSFSADSLRQVDGTFSVTESPNIGSFSFPMLEEADVFTLSVLGPSLLTVDMSAGLTQVNNLTIDNTFLNTFDGFNPATAGSVAITNNELLTDVTMQIANVTGGFTVRGNSMSSDGQGLNVGLSNLVSSGSLIINSVTSLALNSYNTSTGLIAFTDNNIAMLSLPNLTTTAQGLAITGNPQLTNVSTPNFYFCGGALNVVNNTKLTGAISFPEVKAAQSIRLQGVFSSVAMPLLQRVRGAGTFISTKNIQSSCSTIQGKVGGKFTCDSAVASATGSSSSSTSTANAAINYGVPETAFSLFGLLAAALGLLM